VSMRNFKSKNELVGMRIEMRGSCRVAAGSVGRGPIAWDSRVRGPLIASATALTTVYFNSLV
jgi:hypothetical protein